MSSGWIQTVKGQVSVDELGIILPHEHLFTDLRGPIVPEYAQADPEQVVQVMSPFLEAAFASGVSALVECSTVGEGRNVAVLRRLAESTPIHIIAPTGVYRQDYTPLALRDINTIKLAEIWIQDLTDGMERTDIRAGFIKLSMSDDGPTEMEIRNLKAAALASKETGAIIASHTPNGSIVRQEMDILRTAGLYLDDFIWVHANLESDQDIHLEASQQGVYVEFDAIGWDWQSQSALVDYTVSLIESVCADRILLSHDAGWYDPSQPDGQPEGQGIQGFTTLVNEFIPALKERGISDELIHQIIVENPARAFAFSNRGV